MKSNSYLIATAFSKGLGAETEILAAIGNEPEEVAEYIEKYRCVIFVLPLYIHAMPGIMMELIQVLKPCNHGNRSMGFIIQSGFIESSQSRFVIAYFEALAKELGYHYLGSIVKGEAAAIAIFPFLFKSLLKKFEKMGHYYSQYGSFSKVIQASLGRPYSLSERQVRLYQFCCDKGLNDIGWHYMLRKNKAYQKRLDRPYLDNK